MKEFEAFIHLVVAIVLLTLGIQILRDTDTYTSIQNISIIAFSSLYAVYCYKDKLNAYIKNKDDTQ